MKSLPRLSPSRVMILVLTVMAIALGGSTELWEQVVLTFFAAATILFAPPKRIPGQMPCLLMLALFFLALGAFLPASWSTGLPWRHHLTEDLHISLSPIRTPQPWLTAQACCLLFIGLVWATYVLSQRWMPDVRLHATRLLIFGVSILAALALLAYASDFHVPTWNQDENRGWFPNRNQTADVLAICGVINYALIFDCLRKNRASLYLWLCTIAVIAAALVVSYSRAGILMFFGGIVLWHIWPVQHQHKRGLAIKWTVLSLALVFVLLTLFLLFGGETLARFDGALQSAKDNNFRWAIQQDAFHFSLESPGLGVGLGNFEPLFASARVASVNADRAIHPESDWLWAACELGWGAPLLFLAGIGWWLHRCLPFRLKSGESLRRALTVAGVLFILHGFVDVSAHRLGSLYVGLLVFSLAMPAPEGVSNSRAIPLTFRGLSVVILLIGSWWFASILGAPVPPTSASLAQSESEIDDALAHNHLSRMEMVATDGLAIAPLDWHLYFQRAYAETFQAGKLAPASNDFMIARSLESKWVKPCFDEGSTWLAAGQPDLCMDAWTEAMGRTTTQDEGLHLYHQMLDLARSNEMVHSDLRDLAGNKIDYQLAYLDYASGDETKRLIGDIRAQDPDLRRLTRDQREHFLGDWWFLGDREELVTNLTAHPEWLDAGWIFLAQAYAQQKNFQGAWTIVAQYAPPPLVPTVSTNRSLAELQSDFYERDDNLTAGILLYNAQRDQGKPEDAIATLRAMEKNKNCPKYVYYLEAKLWADRQQWELAWNAWWSFYQT